MPVNMQSELLESRARGQATDSRCARVDAARVTCAEVEPFQTGEACDQSVDGGKTLDAAFAGKQVGAYAAHCGVATHCHANRSPEVSHQVCGEPPRLGCTKPAVRLVKVKAKCRRSSLIIRSRISVSSRRWL